MNKNLQLLMVFLTFSFNGNILSANEDGPQTKGYLNGTWQIQSLKEKADGTHPIVAEIQKRISEESLNFSLEVDDAVGTFKLVSRRSDSDTCEVTLPYDVNYCCVRMQKFFLYTSLEKEPSEQPAGCVASHFNFSKEILVQQLQEILYPAFHYYVAGEKMNRILMEGPYKTPTLELDLLRNESHK